MFSSLNRALAQLPDPAFRRVLLLGIAGALVVYLLLVAGAGFLLWNTSLFEAAWAEWTINLLGGMAALLLPLFLFPAVVTLMVGLLLDGVAEAVEARHYPHLPPPRQQGIAEAVAMSVRFTLVAVLLNLLAMPLYFIPGLNLIVFYLLNGYLLGREYFEMVAFRRVTPADARNLRKAHSGRLWLGGAAIAFLSSIPFVNLLAPVVGTAFMAHEFQALRGRHNIV